MASINDQQITRTEFNIYNPVYDTDTDTYKDKCPYLPYQRNRISYNCPCGSNAYFETTTKYNSHIQTKSHKKWLLYTHPKNVEKDREIKRLNKKIRIFKKKLDVQNKRLKKANEQKNIYRETINQLRKKNNKNKKC